MPTLTVAQALAAARHAGVARLDAQLLLVHHLQRPRSWLMAHDETVFDASAFNADLERRATGAPLAYLVGEREFHGLALQVSPAVLVPRPDTELLVDWALERLADPARAWAGAACVADLGTGSGAIALAVKHRCPQAQVLASDVSASALAVARANAQRLALAVEFVTGPWWQPLLGRQFDLVLSNPPYIAGADPHLQALTHEPQLALTPGGDGLAALRDIIAGAPAHLHRGGWLLLEHGHDQAQAVRQLLLDAGFKESQTRRDIAGLERCTGARWPG